MDENFLDTSSLKFSTDFEQLRGVENRTACPGCGAMRLWYCYTCALAIGHVPPKPEHKLPVTIHIVRHNSEKPSKSSIIPLKLTYPDDVRLYTFTQPDRFDKSKTEGTIEPPLPDIDWSRAAIIFPGKSAQTVQDSPQELWKSDSNTKIEHVVLIDSTWSTALQVIEKSPQLRKIPHMIKLGSTNKTIFWRHQRMGRECLATCEAIYVLLREMWNRTESTDYDRRYDDVLYYYIYIHELVNDKYKDGKRHRGHLPDYAVESV